MKNKFIKTSIYSIAIATLVLVPSTILISKNNVNNNTNILNYSKKINKYSEKANNSSHVTQFALGWGFAGAVVEDYTGHEHLYMWGNNENGQLGTGNEKFYSSPTEIDLDGENNYLDSTDAKITHLALGSRHSGAVIKDAFGYDHLYMWGKNSFGQLGTGYDNNVDIVYPVEIDLDGESNYLEQPGSEITQLSFGVADSAAVIKDSNGFSHLYTWGYNSYGQLGDGSIENSNIPKEIDLDGDSNYLDWEGSEITQLSLGVFHSGSVIKDSHGYDHLYMWGSNDEFQLGTGNDEDALTPLEIDSDYTDNYLDSNKAEITHLSLGGYTSAVVIRDDTGKNHLYMWGQNTSGQVGVGNSSISYFPYPIEVNADGADSYFEEEGSEITQLSIGLFHSSTVVRDAKGHDHLYTWGANNYGQLGIGNYNDQSIPTPVDLDGINNYLDQEGSEITQLALGEYSSGAVLRDTYGNDHIYTWGNNEFGQLGVGSFEDNSPTPTEIFINV